MLKAFLWGSGIWVLLVGLSLGWNHNEAKIQRQEIALQTARSFIDQIVIARKWNAGHGGVYVQVGEGMQPNPYLESELRDIVVNDEMTLTMINPAFMTRQLAEIAAESEGLQLHITSLKPIRPENRPDDLETSALNSFESGTSEVGEFIEKDGASHFFYMAPLLTQKECLACHAKHGYKLGDIRGGISVTFPFDEATPFLVLLIAHAFIALFGVTGIVIMGKKLNRAYEAIKQQATFDALTEIPNRRSFSGQLLREFRRSKRDKYPLSLIMCDVDHFKLYNDTYGHKKGDECLKEVAQAIEQTISRPGDFCARYGGEEFVVILPDTGGKGAAYLAEKIRTNVRALAIVHEKAVPLNIVTASFGIATMDATEKTDQVDLVEQADQALYRAKEKGRDRVEMF